MCDVFCGSLHTADLLMQKDRQEKLEWNTKVLDSVFDTIFTLGSQNMPLRGHRDDSKYYDVKGNNPGNFQVMLEYHARSGVTVLAEHLKRTKENSGDRNCTYRSKTIQNEVIKCFEQELRGIIISKVKHAKFFSVMADECSDVANKEQLTIVIHYVNEDDEIFEDFVEFVECENEITGLALTEENQKCFTRQVQSLYDKSEGTMLRWSREHVRCMKWAGSTCHTRISKGSLHVVLVS